MKKTFITIAAVISTIVFTSCSTLKQLISQNSDIVNTLSSLVINNLPANEQVQIKQYAGTLAMAIRTLDPASMPTADKFKALIKTYVPNESKYDGLVSLVASLYINKVQPKVTANANADTIVKSLESVATALDKISGK